MSWKDLFSKQNDLINRKAAALSDFAINLTPQKEFLKNQFEALHVLADLTDKSFSGAVIAQEAKQIKGLENLEKRLLKAQKRKLADELTRVTALQEALFPNKGLQERQVNFSEFYIEYGNQYIQHLLHEQKPLENLFNVVTLEG